MEFTEADIGELVGMQVMGTDGRPLGAVVDVGLVDWRHPKFLLVEQPDHRLLRVEYGRVTDIGRDGIRLGTSLAMPRPP